MEKTMAILAVEIERAILATSQIWDGTLRGAWNLEPFSWGARGYRLRAALWAAEARRLRRGDPVRAEARTCLRACLVAWREAGLCRGSYGDAGPAGECLICHSLKGGFVGIDYGVGPHTPAPDIRAERWQRMQESAAFRKRPTT